jgi:hypothetical protein
MRRIVFSGLVCLLPLAWGCAHKPTEELTNAKASLIAAQELGADRNDASQTYLFLARRQTEQANKLMEDGDNRGAKLMLERAQADADLALALSREDPLRAEVKRTLAELKVLQRQGDSQ